MSRPGGGYTLNGEHVPGVTDITKLIGTPSHLLKWYLRGGKEGWDPEQERDRAAAIGTAFHSLVEAYVCGNAEPAHILSGDDYAFAYSCFERWLDWWRTQSVTIIDLEVCYVSHAQRYAGTIDMLGKCNRTGEIVLYDWKSGSIINEGAVAQVAAYLKAAEEHYARDGVTRPDGAPWRIDRVEIVNPPNNISRGSDEKKTTKLNHYVWRREELEPAYQAFVYALRLYRTTPYVYKLLKSGRVAKRKRKELPVIESITTTTKTIINV